MRSQPNTPAQLTDEVHGSKKGLSVSRVMLGLATIVGVGLAVTEWLSPGTLEHIAQNIEHARDHLMALLNHAGADPNAAAPLSAPDAGQAANLSTSVSSIPSLPLQSASEIDQGIIFWNMGGSENQSTELMQSAEAIGNQAIGATNQFGSP